MRPFAALLPGDLQKRESLCVRLVCLLSHSVMGNPDVVESLWEWVLAPTVPVRAQWPRRAARWAGVWSTLAALEEQILDVPVPRMAGQVKKTVREVFSQDRVQPRLVKQTMEVRKGPVEQFFELLEPQMAEQFVEVPKIVVGLAVSTFEGRDTTDAAATAVDVPVGEARPPVKLGLLGPEQTTRLALSMKQLQKLLSPEIAEHSVTTALVSRERVQQRIAKQIEETARPHGIAKQSATIKPELAESSGEAGSVWK